MAARRKKETVLLHGAAYCRIASREVRASCGNAGTPDARGRNLRDKQFRSANYHTAGGPADNQHAIVVGKQESLMSVARGGEGCACIAEATACGIENFCRRKVVRAIGSADDSDPSIEQRSSRMSVARRSQARPGANGIRGRIKDIG